MVSSSNFPSLLSHSSEYKVSISGTRVELTCAKNLAPEIIHWDHNDKKIGEGKHLIREDFSEMKDSGYYACYSTSTSEKYQNYLYLKAKGKIGLQCKHYKTLGKTIS